jgi:hypothetical protein
MEEQNNSDQDEYQITEGDLLNTANNILSLLNSSQKLENEEDLFLDDFYVSIIGSLLSDVQPEITPGNTIQEKAKIMDKLVQSLSKAIEVDLPHINGSGIVLNHDKVSAKNLLDVISELIKTIIDNNLEEVEEEKNEENEKNFSDNKMKEENKKQDLNKRIEEYQVSDNDIEKNENIENENNKEEEKNNLDENENIETEQMKQSQESSLLKLNSSCFEPLHFQKMIKEMKDKENKVNNSYLRQTYSQNDISRYERNREDAERNREENDEENENIILDEQINKDLNQRIQEPIINDKEEESPKSPPIMNVSNISDMNKEKEEENTNKKFNEKEHSPKNKKKSNDIPNLLNHDEKKEHSSQKKSSNKKEINKYNYMDKDEENPDLKYNENQESEIDFDFSENKTAYSMPPAYLKLTLEESEKNANLDDKINFEKEKEKGESILDDSHIIKGSQMDKSIKFNEDEELEQEDLEFNNYTHSQKDSNKKSNNLNSNTKSNKKKDSNSKKSSNTKHKNSQKKSSLGKKIEKEAEETNLPKNEIKEEKDEKNEDNAKKENVQQSHTETNQENKISANEGNIQMDDDDWYKYQIMKEFRKIYGDKLDYIFLKYNSQFSPNIIELALRNIKLAKENMLKLGADLPPKDDPKIWEYLQKYEKELELMLLNYNKEQKKQEISKEKKLNAYGKKIKQKQKMEEIERIQTENEIERRQRAKQIKNYHKRMIFGNNVYKKALEMEKQKNLENIKKEKEIINQENEEKRKALIAIEKYYKDQIKMLKEILAKEKRERDIEHREYMVYLNKKDREVREEYKKQINEIFQRFDEEDRIEEFENENNPEIKRIFDAYYGY